MNLLETPQEYIDSESGFINSSSWAGSLNWIYFLGMKAWWQAIITLLLGIIPLVGLGMFIYCIVNGRRIAWKSHKWDNFDIYKEAQIRWDKAAKWYWGVVALIMIGGLIVSIAAHQPDTRVSSAHQVEKSQLASTSSGPSTDQLDSTGQNVAKNSSPGNRQPSTGSFNAITKVAPVCRQINNFSYNSTPKPGEFIALSIIIDGGENVTWSGGGNFSDIYYASPNWSSNIVGNYTLVATVTNSVGSCNSSINLSVVNPPTPTPSPVFTVAPFATANSMKKGQIILLGADANTDIGVCDATAVKDGIDQFAILNTSISGNSCRFNFSLYDYNDPGNWSVRVRLDSSVPPYSNGTVNISVTVSP